MINRTVCLLSLSLLTPSLAAADFQLEEVVVTAQKREQSLQDVPIAVSAFDSSFIEVAGIEELGRLSQFTPGFTLEAETRGEPALYIRGIGSNDFGVGGDTSVGVYLDDVYIGRGTSAMFDISDAERVEILKGPQGTLFGRNSIGGAISVVTKRPGEELAGQVSAEVGSFNKRRLRAEVDLPLSDEWRLRLGGHTNKRDGYIKNNFDGTRLANEDDQAAQMTLLYAPAGDFEALFKLGHEEMDSDGAATRSLNPDFLSGSPFDDYFSELGAHTGHEQRELFRSSLHLNWELGDYTLKSITAYHDTEYDNRKDQTGTGLREVRLFTNMDITAEQYSQEFRLNFDNGGDVFWFAGVSHFVEDVEQTSLLESTGATVSGVVQGIVDTTVSRLFGVPVSNFPFMSTLPVGNDYFETLTNGGDYSSTAIYGDLTWSLNDRLDLTFGARYSYDKKEHFVDSVGGDQQITVTVFGVDNVLPGIVYNAAPRADNEDSWSAFTPRMVLSFHQQDNLMWYGSVTQGYKSGGFNSFVPNDDYDEETVTSYEFGVKSSGLDNRLRFNGSVFYYDYEDLQVNSIENAKVVLRNAGEAAGQGVEFELLYLAAENLTLSLNGGYLDTEFKTFNVVVNDLVDANGDPLESDLSGNKLTYAPEFQVSAFAEYTQSLENTGELRYRLDYSFIGQRYFDPDNDPTESENATHLLDARIVYADTNEAWEVAVFVKNLSDEEYLINAGGLAKDKLNAPKSHRAEPRTWGAEVSYRF